MANRGGAGGYRNWAIANGSRVSVEWSVEYMERDSMTLGQRIKQIRLERGETTSEFAKHLTASKGTVSKWENGKYEPNRKRLKKIANLGNTTVDELLHGKPSEMTTALAIIDYYIEHYTKLEHNDTVRKLKEIRIDMENADQLGRSD